MILNLYADKVMLLIYCQPLYRIVVAMVLEILIWGYLCYRFCGVKYWRTIVGTLLVFSCCAIYFLTVLARNTGTRELWIEPLHSLILAQSQPEYYREMLMNVFLFTPIGLFASSVLPRRWTGLLTVIVAMVFAGVCSLTIEASQYVLMKGTSEVDDVITNMLGGFVGAMSIPSSRLISFLVSRRCGISE